MTYDLILANIRKHITLSEHEEYRFISQLEPRQLSRNDLVLQQGQLCSSIHFVNSGTLRAFHSYKAGKESTIMFAPADWWVTDMYCFIHQQPAMLTIEAICEAEILQLEKQKLDRLYVEVPKFERFFRIIIQNAYIREQLRVIQNLSMSAEERYHQFVAKYPEVARQVTLRQIASYLGITPEFLSTIRANKK